MSLSNNSADNADGEQDLSDGWSKVQDECQSTTLTDDIIQKLDVTGQIRKSDQKLLASINLSLTKKWIVHKLVREHYPSYIIGYKNIKIKMDVDDSSLSDQLKKKWQLAVDERIPLFLSYNESCQAVILLQKLYPTPEEFFNQSSNMLLKLPLFPKNIKEMCIIRYWLDKLSRCAFKEAEFDNIIFNPVLIELLFEDEKNDLLQFYTKQTTLRYCIANFEHHAMKFVRDNLIIETFIVEFSLCNDTEQCNEIILNILNEGSKIRYVRIMSQLQPSIVELIKNKIITSTNCPSIVPRIDFKVIRWDRAWNFNYLHNRDGVKTKDFFHYGNHMYSSKYEIANNDDPNVVFSINYLGSNNVYSGLDFKIKRN
uniref:BACK domain-containing protein n=1 Tax=Meloidogyne hapla TaxID=6305 RepID=A0A1I8B537_MELHA